MLGSFSTARVVCERWRARAWFSSSSSFMKGALGEDREIYRSTRVREENPKAKAGSHRRTDLKLRKTQVSVIGGGGVWGGGMQKFELFIGSSMVSNFDINRLQMFQLEEISKKKHTSLR